MSSSQSGHKFNHPSIFLKALFIFTLALIMGRPPSTSLATAAPQAKEEDRTLAAQADLADRSLPPAEEDDSDSAVHGGAKLDTRDLPPDLNSEREIVDYRTPYSATFQNEDGSYTAILSAQPMHYRTAEGHWLAIDPAFQSSPEGFAVEHNSIQSQAGLRKAWLGLRVGQTAAVWEATALGTSGENGFQTWAEPLQEGPLPEKRESGTVLHYAASWSDESLAEQIISAPDSVEHALVLDTPPPDDVTAEFLELQATLDLLPGASLWLDGNEQKAAFSTEEGIEVRDDQGQVAFIFKPVIAYEQESRETAVSGSYHLQPSDKEDQWLVSLRTPYSWWADPQRQYPAVLDPTIEVKRTSGAAGYGMAWINSAAGENKFRLGILTLGAVNFKPFHTKGFLQFNSMPGVIQGLNGQNQVPLQIEKAYLDLAPTGLGVPGWKHKKGSYPKWNEIVHKRPTEVFYIPQGEQGYKNGNCPDGFQEFSMLDNRLENPCWNFNNSPGSIDGTSMGVEILQAGPVTKKIEPVTTTWDVTSKIKEWYSSQYATYPTRLGPTFMVEFTDFCKGAGPYHYGKSPWVPGCTVFDIGLNHARLRIEYNKPPLGPDDNFLNIPGVPSHNPDVFNQETTPHQFDLNTGGLSAWRAFAVRGNHDVQQTVPTRANLHFVRGDNEKVVSSGDAPDQTVFMLMDGHNSAANLSEPGLTAEVTDSNTNNFEQDQQRNYRLHYVNASSTVIPTGSWQTRDLSIRSDRLVNMIEFELNLYDNVLIVADGYPDLELFFVQSTLGDGLSAGLVDKNGNELNDFITTTADGTYRISGKGRVDIPGKWAVAVLNESIPEPNPDQDPQEPDDDYLWRDLSLRILRCKDGEIPTFKHACQPIVLPSDPFYSAPNPPGKQLEMPTYGLKIYSPDFDVASPNENVDWCTAGEGDGTPLIESTSLANQNIKKWVAVVQGSLCYTAATKTLQTTADSAIVLTIPDTALSIQHRGGYSPDFTYGRADISPIPSGEEDGIVQIQLQNNPLELLPTGNTLRYIEPFKTNWTKGGEYAHTKDFIDLSGMTLESRGMVNAKVTHDPTAAPISVSWSVPWSLYPNFNISHGYNFEITPDQQGPLPQPLTIAGANLRVYNEAFDLPSSGIFDKLLYMNSPGGPVAYQFFASYARLTHTPELGGASKYVTAVIQPPGKALLPDGQFVCSDNGTDTSCLDLRVPTYNWNNGTGKDNVQNWELPDIMITGQAATVAFASEGLLNVYSIDHPLAAQNINQTFAFETWSVTAKTSQGPCTPGGPTKTIINGSGFMALPMIGSDGSGPGPHIDVQFTLCDNALHHADLTFGVLPTPVPVGSTGFGVDVIGGEITVGPDATTVALNVGLLTQDRYTVTKGDQVKNGTVTINTDGLFSMEGSGIIVGKLNANYSLDISWEPLDVLQEGEVSYGGGLITGFMRLHGWFGQGWQNKYSYLPANNDFHFTGKIGAKVQIKKGQLIDEKYLKVPWFNAAISAEVAFGEFCSNSSSCLPINWGMSATVKVFGYGVGIYVDKSGPEIFLGSSGKVLVDQCSGCGSLVNSNVPAPQQRSLPADNGPDALLNFDSTEIPPGAVQPYLEQSFPNPFQDAPTYPSNTFCSGDGTSNHSCPFYLDTTTHKGRAMFTASWLNGDLDVSLVNPSGVTITQDNAAQNHVTITPFVDDAGLRQGVNFVVNAATAGASIPLGEWKIILDGVALDPDPLNYYSLSMASDPPPPTVQWTSVLNPGQTPVNDIMALTWQAKRSGQNLEPGVTVDLFYAPVHQPPLWQNIAVSFPGSYQDEAGLGTDWDPQGGVIAGDPNQDGIWRIAANVPAGDYAFLVARNGALEEYYGEDGLYHGQEISFTVPLSPTDPVIFMYDPRDNVAMATSEHPVVNLVGDMMDQVSPTAVVDPNWNPANLAGWMKPGIESDSFYETTLQIPEGQYHFKIALNESWDENYGLGGLPDGAEIPFEVPQGGALVRFTFDYETKEITYELLGGTPGTMITRLDDPNAGFYNWPTFSLTDGEYRVGLRIDDHFKGNGQITSWAPGTVLIGNDNVPPPDPVLPFPPIPKKDAIDVFWQRDDSTLDLAGYLIEYDVPGLEPDTTFRRTKRMVPLPYSFSPFYQHTRLVGMLMSDPNFPLPEIVSSICVRAYDHHGNTSGCNPTEVVMPDLEGAATDPPIGPPQNLIVQDGEPLEITWIPPLWGTPTGYMISYAPTGCLISDTYPPAAEGLPPIIVRDTVLNTFLNGLVQDQGYLITVQAITANGELSEPVTATAVAGNRVDGDNNGLPDIWAEIYGLEDPNGDQEGDGLSNLREASMGTNPFNADSDFDGHYDGAELAWGTDLCGPETPPYQAQGKLTLSGPDRLSFEVSANNPLSDPQTLTIFNTGQGELQWTALPSENWIQLSQSSGGDLDDLQVSVDANGLQWGIQQEYAGEILIFAAHAAVLLDNGNTVPAITEYYTIPVELVLLPPVEGITQAIDLQSGWNLVSSYITPTEPTLPALLSGMPEIRLVKNGNGQIYWPEFGINQIGSWDHLQGYQVYATSASPLNLTGSKSDAGQAISLPAGWNMVAYLPMAPMPAQEALSTLSGQLLLAKDGLGNVYWPEMDINQIGDMQPGLGYQMHLVSPGSLSYPVP